jgi:hypothetical protein
MSVAHRRPWGVTILTLFVLTIACLSLLRFVLSLAQWRFLSSLPGVSPVYLALSGLVWASLGFILFWGLWRKKGWAPRRVGWGALLYALYFWLDRLFAAAWLKTGTPPANTLFAAFLTITILAAVFWILSRSKHKAFFGEPHERPS